MLFKLFIKIAYIMLNKYSDSDSDSNHAHALVALK